MTLLISPRGAALLVCLAAVIPYLSTINDYFVQDDFGVVWLLSQKPWSAFPGWFVSTWMDRIWGYTPDEIRPFPAVTYQVAALWGAASPVANHAMNIALHAGNGLLVLAVARVAAGLRLAAATCAALVFVLLPSQAESVAWVTGRVDSMPAFAYLAAFVLYALWRQRGNPRAYWASVAVFFVALFTKQNAITFGPAIVLFDVVIGRRPVRPSWKWVRPYAPFALLTLGYLALRFVLFGEVARESQLSAANLEYFGTLIVRHLRRMMFGDVSYGAPALWLAAGVLMVVLLRAAPRVTIYFGVAWWLLGVAPVLVAVYESPRHIYLASLSWAILVGLTLEVAARRPMLYRAAAAAVAMLIAFYTVQLAWVVDEWNTRARVSQRAVADLEREALAAPQGALIIASAPVRSWEWALPFVLRPPFVTSPLEPRVSVITPQLLHCCRSEWEDFTRTTVRGWLARDGRPPVIALRWDGETGALFRMTEREEPYLRPLLEVIADTDSADALDRAILNLVDRLPPASD
jgi:hypothetical protein